MKKQTFDIDFIIPWVDNTDPEWQKKYNLWNNSILPSQSGSNQENNKSILNAKNKLVQSKEYASKLYRDYGLLKYWFRGIENFAPYVRKIHFITNGQKPDWLNLNNKKVNWIKHEDYMPAECLPVFSSHPIELLMNRIPDLAEHFVYFNDDFFLTSKTEPEFFFKNGLPCDYAISNIQNPSRSLMRKIVINDLTEINRCFNKKEYFFKSPLKYINPKYGKMNIRTLACLLWPETSGFQNYHLAQPYLKSTLDNVWEKCPEALNYTIHSRFRNENDVNQWLFRYWQLCSGTFTPVNPKKENKYFELTMDIDEICRTITSQKYKEIILNDSICSDFDEKIKKIQKAFEQILPAKSDFEI